MEIIGKILRTVSLAILFGGSAAIVIAVVVLVKAAKAKGIPVEEAAMTNAPVFITYAKVNLGAGIALLIGEAMDYAKRKLWNKPTVAQYACSLICVATTMIFAFGMAPPMERMLPSLKTDAAVKQEFDQLHKTSQMVFGSTIVFALASIILPIFGALKTAKTATETESA